MTPAERLAREIQRLVGTETRRTADLRSATVEGRNRDGTTVVIRDDGECPVRGPKTGDQLGDQVYLTGARGGRRGTTSAPIRTTPGDPGSGSPPIATLWVERLTPHRFSRGESVTVLVEGDGFSPLTQFWFLDPDNPEVPNPDVALAETRYLSPNEVEIDLVIAADARVLDGAALRYADAGAVS
ncbi:MAG TPA: hypothetical protein VGS22_16470 [Thermoanaerobaculia bacterium]|nr:hypothetical protein [Thermoanaerobaculia bacterium]